MVFTYILMLILQKKPSSEADHAIRLLQGKKFKYPVYYDLEEDAIRKKLSKTEIANIAKTFCNKLSAKGYTVWYLCEQRLVY